MKRDETGSQKKRVRLRPLNFKTSIVESFVRRPIPLCYKIDRRIDRSTFRATVKCWVAPCCCLLLFASFSRESLAQNPSAQKKLESAVARGMRFLEASQRPNGSWSYPGHDVGMTALAGLALMECGVSANDSRLKTAHGHVLKKSGSVGQTYDLSVVLLFLDRYGARGDTELMLRLGRQLADGQLVSGGWTYTCVPGASGGPRSSIRRREGDESSVLIDLQRDVADNCNTQFAVWGLWAARRHGLDVRGNMELVDQRFRATQARNGQWDYRPGVKLTSDSMTCAGLTALVVAKGCRTIEEHKREKAATATPQGALKMPSDKIIDRGLKRVEGIRLSSKSSKHLMWSLAQVADTLKVPKFGEAWRERGTRILMRMQNGDGSWRNSTPVPPSSKVADTAFALLFLRRSNLTGDVPRLLRTGAKKPRTR